MWRARPDFLPTGTGSDLAHHLALLAYLEQHGRLPHDAILGAYLGEMIDYTPGAHLLAVLAGAWLHRDALHALHPVVAVTAALKSGFVFLIARRLMPRRDPARAVRDRRRAAAVAARTRSSPARSWSSRSSRRSCRSCSRSRCGGRSWRGADSPRRGPMALFALFGVAGFLTWPIWIGPLILTLVLVVARGASFPSGDASPIWRSRSSRSRSPRRSTRPPARRTASTW